ncbi:helix-turn-helix transcriptional regulator [Parapedobacter sp. SGR-10]|uniref:AraC family transcriptional regulator n=1 Tax=Parapedobacter sp. SGR-10 TaxID=2710879 RepID=UPI0013D19731|nr:AraC family transcriptional regulator [Parapedobacter sp. SGR-10]NGF56964.1 helix-turn-helix transcriptional regulator [Parapedobacter sp. SGR-10]
MVIEYTIPHRLEQLPVREHIIPKGRYFNFLQKEHIHIGTEHLYIASRKVDGQIFVEIKCALDKNWRIHLRQAPTTFWMAFQFFGSSSPAPSENPALGHQQYLGFFSENEDMCYHFNAGKVWMVLIGVELENPMQLSEEWHTLVYPDNNSLHLLPTVNIAFRNRKILEQIQRIKDTPVSLRYQLHYQTIQLIETYHGDLLQYQKSAKKEDISLFHQAKAYIVAHYMDENIDIRLMAQELLTSERTLYRIFQENGLTVNSAIQAIRIHKGREMLRQTDESVDMIAFHLQFSTAKYFIRQYVKYFGHTPAMERKMVARRQLEDYVKED